MNSLRLLSLICTTLLALPGSVYSPPAKAEASCPAESRITRDFDNGSRWDLCWESRIRENIVLSDIHYTPPGKTAFKVLGSARLSQLHVAYDDNDVTYNDVTQYGLGGSYLETLTQADCPDGELLSVQTRPAVCITQSGENSGHTASADALQADSMHLFSVSQVGAYAYIVSWTFYDNGTFEPGVGATGALQRSSNDVTLPYGRVLQGDPDTLWLSHTHNYYWRLDFDLGASATDDTVAELTYPMDTQGRRELNTQAFSIEQARRIDPDLQLQWRIMDGNLDTAAGYQLEPVRTGHRFERKDIEPYSDYDFFVTVASDCERFASQNSRFNPECEDNVLEFADGQSLLNQDIVVWNRVSFHHTPRSEDQRHMHTHWDDFRIRPVNLLSRSSSLSGRINNSPEFPTLPDIQTTMGELVHADMLQASDEDGDLLSYSATGLPPGLGLRANGHIHGYPEAEGRYAVTVIARDNYSETQASFEWTVRGAQPMSQRKTSGSIGYLTCLFLFLMVLVRLLYMRYQLSYRTASTV